MSLRDTSPEIERAVFASLAEAREARMRMERALGVELPPAQQEVELAELEEEQNRRSA